MELNKIESQLKQGKMSSWREILIHNLCPSYVIQDNKELELRFLVCALISDLAHA